VALPVFSDDLPAGPRTAARAGLIVAVAAKHWPKRSG
jgi:hypothetical protein